MCQLSIFQSSVALVTHMLQVGPRTAWRSPDHPFRTDPSLALRGIPTLLALAAGTGTVTARISSELEAAASPAEARGVVEKFLAQSTHP